MLNSSTNKTKRYGNRLSNEKSPYLLQHAKNAVDWYPWGKEAFQVATCKNKPIFLSIGYSTCHWCHVMEKESFNDPQVAELLNDAFVCIKVDREERPDIDNIYMTACQVLTGTGGWPLTIFMTPSKKPFYATTYIPKTLRFGKLGLMELIPKIKAAWELNKSEIQESAENITRFLQETDNIVHAEEINDRIVDNAYKDLSKVYDRIHGGFGSTPKFPTFHYLLFLLRYWKRNSKSNALQMVEHTLQKMQQGGIYDHLGYGFHRYSTDAEWLIPHFEKMLYDQALGIIAYTHAFQVTNKDIYKKTALQILNYVERELTDSQGGFYSAVDADSDDEEGKFYFWSYDDIKKVLGEDADFAVKVYNIKRLGNFHDKSMQRSIGENILHFKHNHDDNAKQLGMSVNDYFSRLERIRNKLFKKRKQRSLPFCDDKILTDWNGLMIAAFAQASRVFNIEKLTYPAKKAADFILEKMRVSENILYHRYRHGEAGLQANLDDYAFMVWGLFELYETTFDINYFNKALELNDSMMKHFLSDDESRFYYTPDFGERLLFRQNMISDGAIPSGNSVALMNAIRLSRISGNTKMMGIVDKITRNIINKAKQTPIGYIQLISAVDLMLGPIQEIVIIGDPEHKQTKKMLSALAKEYLPNSTVLFVPLNKKNVDISKFAPQIEKLKAIDNKPTAYICIDNKCLPAINSIEKMLKILKSCRNTGKQ